jgi:hypothetical protein
VCYSAFSVPAVVAGIAVTHYGLRDTAVVYAGVVIVLALIAALASELRLSATTRLATSALTATADSHRTIRPQQFEDPEGAEKRSAPSIRPSPVAPNHSEVEAAAKDRLVHRADPTISVVGACTGRDPNEGADDLGSASPALTATRQFRGEWDLGR